MASQTRITRSLLHDVMQKEMTEPIEMPNNLDTAITFKLCEQSGVTWIETPTPDPINSLIIYEKPKLVVHVVFRVLLSDVKSLPRRRRYTQVGAKILSILGVEEHLQAPILGKLFQVIEAAVPGVPITVFLTSVIVNLLNSESDAGMGDVTLRSWDRERPVDDESVIDSLEATIRETPLCAICLEGLDHYGVVEYGTDHQPSMSTTTCFPCSHLYHRNCITQWLEKNPSCPLCRCKMPDVEAVGDAGMGDVTLPLGGQERPVDDEVVIDTGTRVNFIPATESSIEALEQVRLDSLEATIRETWLCDIFWEGLDHYEALEQVSLDSLEATRYTWLCNLGREDLDHYDGTDHQPLMITRCSRICHRDCLGQWLQINQWCPFCRYPNNSPVVEAVGEPSRPTGRRRLHWPRIVMSAAGIITDILLCRLSQRS